MPQAAPNPFLPVHQPQSKAPRYPIPTNATPLNRYNRDLPPFDSIEFETC